MSHFECKASMCVCEKRGRERGLPLHYVAPDKLSLQSTLSLSLSGSAHHCPRENPPPSSQYKQKEWGKREIDTSSEFTVCCQVSLWVNVINLGKFFAK